MNVVRGKRYKKRLCWMSTDTMICLVTGPLGEVVHRCEEEISQ